MTARPQPDRSPPGEGDQAAGRPAADQPDVQRPEDEARPVRHELLLRADHVARPDHLRGHLGAHQGDRAAGRRARLRGAGADRPLARLRRHARTSTATASRPTPGRRAWPRRRRTSRSSPPRTCRRCTRSSPRRPPPRSTTSPAGRFGLNLVMGWFSPEMDMFHGEQRQHDERYAFGQEWIDLVKKLWCEEGSFDVDGLATSRARTWSPTRSRTRPRGPVLINAGNSPSGRRVLRPQRRHQLRVAGHAGEHVRPTRRPSRQGPRRVRPRHLDDDLRPGRRPRHREGGQGGLPVGDRPRRLGRGGQRHEGRRHGEPVVQRADQAVPGALHRRVGAATRWSAPPSRSSRSWAGSTRRAWTA